MRERDLVPVELHPVDIARVVLPVRIIPVAVVVEHADLVSAVDKRKATQAVDEGVQELKAAQRHLKRLSITAFQCRLDAD